VREKNSCIASTPYSHATIECGKKEADHENVLVLVDALMELPWGRIANLYAVP
jgi:hypothetical protein